MQEFDWSDAEDDEIPVPTLKSKKSKQSEHPLKIIPTASDASSDDDSEEEDEPVTMANMEARSRALDAQADAEAELDAEEFRQNALNDDDDDDDFDMDDGEDEADGEKFHLPTAEEREEEKARGGPDLHVVQRRMRECARVLARFKKLSEPERYVTSLRVHAFVTLIYRRQITVRIHRANTLRHLQLLRLQ